MARKIKTLFHELHVGIDEPRSDDDEFEDDYLDQRVPGRPFPSDVDRVLQFIGRAEYNNALEHTVFVPSWDNKMGISSYVNYCLPNELPEDAEVMACTQSNNKILRWSISLYSDEERDCPLTFFIFHRDALGNLRNLHHDSLYKYVTVYPDKATQVLINITREYDQPLECGRYYLAVLTTPPFNRLNQEPAIIYLNLVPPTGKIEYVRSSLVGMDAVYRQMSKLVQQKIFNDRREAVNLVPTAINLHAAVMGSKGSGKTSFAQVIYDFYKKNGLIGDGKLRVIDASRWVTLTEDLSNISTDMTKARNGLLYIENAAAMIPADTRGSREYVVEALIRELRDNTHNTTVVLADTPEKLTELLAIADLHTYIGQTYHLPTLNLDQILEVAVHACQSRGFTLTPNAKNALRVYLSDQPHTNTTDVVHIVEKMIMNMSTRVVSKAQGLFLDNNELTELTEDDVPKREISLYEQAISKLNNLVGLKQIKENVESHLNLVRFAQLRSQHGLSAVMPPLHMIFTGNPGTGKTTVANLLGEIYASLGILKTGKVIQVDRKKLVGRYIGDTEDNTKRVLQQAHGNILFIDDAYDLVEDPTDKRDFGPKVLDCLLEELSKESTDMIIIMAGYPEDMQRLLDSNKGLQSRFPYTFHFEDYSEEELLEIAVRTAQQYGYTFSDEALQRVRELIHREMERGTSAKKHFGNARFVTRLISTQIIPNMSRRVLASDLTNASPQLLSRIELDDVPTSLSKKTTPHRIGFGAE